MLNLILGLIVVFFILVFMVAVFIARILLINAAHGLHYVGRRTRCGNS